MQYYQTQANDAHPWPYPVDYGKEHVHTCDVLVVGGGIAGCHAAINAARRGAKVTVVDKAWTKVSGAGGAGVDHWHDAQGNPCCKLSVEDMMDLSDKDNPYEFGFIQYIAIKESYDGLLDLESMGMNIRDVNDEFKGAAFRDEETKLMFAYDYENKHVMRVPAGKVKDFLYDEMVRLGVELCDYTMITSLLNKDSVVGGDIVGAVGFHVHTGEFHIFQSKATILSTAKPLRLWNFDSEKIGSNAEHDDPNCAGDGCALGAKAGAKLVMMEKLQPGTGGFRYPAYGTGNAHNTWFPCNIVDAAGKTVPWIDRDGEIMEDFYDRLRPAKGQTAFLHGPGNMAYHMRGPSLIPDLPERIAKGEYQLPLYADLPSMPPLERRAIWGLMVGNEGKTRVPIYKNYGAAGFDPDKHMLQANVLPADLAGTHMPWWNAGLPSLVREVDFLNSGGIAVDWDLKTNLGGLYAAGEQIPSNRGHVGAVTTGRYAGRSAAKYVDGMDHVTLDRTQIDAEKERIYSHVKIDEGMGWKELQIGLCRAMQDYMGESMSKSVLETGLWWLNTIRETDLARTYAMNPHELMRVLECEVRLEVGELMMQSALAREESDPRLGFHRMDFPQQRPDVYDQFLTITLDGNKDVQIGKLPFDFWLKAPYATTYEENYQAHGNLD